MAFSDIKMQIGEATAEVTVEATESQAVKPLDTPERSDVLTAKDLETLAIVGRDATELIETLPGFSVISPGVNNQASANTAAVGLNNGITGGFSSNGAGPTGLATVLDGVSLTDIQHEHRHGADDRRGHDREREGLDLDLQRGECARDLRSSTRRPSTERRRITASSISTRATR